MMNNSTICTRDDRHSSEACLQPGAPSCCFPDLPYSFTLVSGLYWLLTGIIGTVGNAITLIALPYARRRCRDPFSSVKTYTTLLLLHLSLADCIFCATAMTFGGINMLMRRWPLGQLGCRVIGFCMHFFGIASRFLLAITTFYRALTLWCPKASNTIFHSGKGIPALTAIWIYPLCFPVAVIIEGGFGYSRASGNCLTTLVDTPVTNKLYGASATLPLVLTVASLAFIGVKLHQNWSQICTFKDVSPTIMQQLRERERRMNALLLVLAVIYILSLAPNISIYLFTTVSPWTEPYIYVNFLTFIYFPSNFIIYIVRLKAYRVAYIRFFRDVVACCKPKVKKTFPAISHGVYTIHEAMRHLDNHVQL